MIKPRKLRLLIVDDELRPSLSGYMIPDLLDLWYPGEGIPGITSWQAAIQFWKSFQGGVIPDLVVADVRFVNDDTSPLSRLFQYPEVNNIPTGLSHLKTFAVLARALRLPLGVGIRTMDPSLWRKQIESSKYEDKAMGLLAAHEAGELASILGDDIQLGGFEDCQHIDTCLDWLRNRSGTIFELGLKMALRDYRRRLYLLLASPGAANVFVRPSHYAELMGWCHRMERDPRPLDAANDFGLELTYHNGKRDVISLASLFSDYDWIATRALEPSSFTVDGADRADVATGATGSNVREPWKLDDSGRPRIGAFLKPLGSLNAALNDAAETLREYQISYPLPESYKPPTLAAIKKRSRYASLTTALAVLLQFVRIAQKKVEEWEDRFGVYAWEPDKLQFISDPPSPDHSLLQVLQDLTSLISSTVATGDEFTIDDIFESQYKKRTAYVDMDENDKTRWVKEIVVTLNGEGRPEIRSGNWIRIRTDRSEQNNDWVKWHFERLVDARVLEHRRVGCEDFYVLREDWRQNRLLSSPPPAPPGFPKVITAMQRLQPPCRCKKNGEEKTGLPEYPTSIQWLKVSLGYNCYSDYNSVERELGAAFGFIATRDEAGGELEKSALKAKAGRLILNELEKGELPFFLAEICREYATQYLKWPREKWPKWLIE
jgi:hypothetical protein